MQQKIYKQTNIGTQISTTSFKTMSHNYYMGHCPGLAQASRQTFAHCWSHSSWSHSNRQS